MLIFWNNLNIFKWNNTYLHLYEITCKRVYEIGKIEIFNLILLKGHWDSKKHWKQERVFFFPNILKSIRTFWNITTYKKFIC